MQYIPLYIRIRTVEYFVNCSFEGNTIASSNSNHPTCLGAFRAISPTNVSNCIFWNNGSSSYPIEVAGNMASVDYSIVEGDWSGTNQSNVLLGDPLFAPVTLEPGAGSPAIDAASTALYIGGSVDIDGDARTNGPSLDMGAQEHTIDPNLFVTTWNADNGDGTESVTINTLNGHAYNYTVDWGDGTTTIEMGTATHTYPTATSTPISDATTVYQIKISGTFSAIYCNGLNQAEKDKLLSIDQWGTGQWGSMFYAFSGCVNMQYNATDLSAVTGLRATFQGCTSFDGDLSNWNTSSIVDMSYTFKNATAFNGNVTTWDVSNATAIHATFSQATSFNQDLKDWEVGSVINMGYMFYQCPNFNSDLSKWDVSLVQYMNYMFSGCTSFTNGNNNYNGESMNSWVTNSLLNTRTMFQSCAAFNRDISNWDMDQVSDMSYMFKLCSVFDQDISGWDVGAATTMLATFQDAIAFDQDLSGWDVSQVTNMSYLFYRATGFNQSLGAWNIGSVGGMVYMLTSTGLDECNYDATLDGWNTNHQSLGLALGAQGLQYGDIAFRDGLTGANGGPGNWTISDAGQGNVCPSAKRGEELESEAAAWSVYPNPASDFIFVSGTEGPVYTELFEMSGKQVMSESGNTIDVSQIPTGVYFLKITDEKGNQRNEKLIIQ